MYLEANDVEENKEHKLQDEIQAFGRQTFLNTKDDNTSNYKKILRCFLVGKEKKIHEAVPRKKKTKNKKL